MRGALPTPCAWTARIGSHSPNKIPFWNNCGCCAATNWPSLEERTALVNQLQAALHEYYPTALEAFEHWTLPAAWAFVEAFSSPQALASAGKRRSRKISPYS